jgi:hypothetical protein
MSDLTKKHRRRTAVKLLSGTVVVVLCVLLLVMVAVRIYLSSALPAPQLSRFVTSYLHQNFTVKSVEASGDMLLLKGVRLENPAGFLRGTLAEADAVAIAPDWGDLLFGKQRFRLIELQGIRIKLDKNSSGIWNFSQLQRLFGAKKPSAKETYIRELVVKDGALQVQGQGVQGIALRVFSLTTKGSLDSKLDLAFEDAAHNRYLLKGKGRAGSDAAVDVALTAPSLSLKDTARLLKLKNPALFDGGTGALQLNASFHKGELSATGDLSFGKLQLPAARKNYPLTGNLHFAADYSTQSDSIRLHNATLTITKLMKLHAGGSVRDVKQEREFALYLGMDEVDLGALNDLVPDESRKQLLFGGRLRCDSLHLIGSGSKGLKSAVGTLQLRDASLARGDKLLVAGLSGTVGVSRRDDSILAKGKLSVSAPHEKAQLQALDIPFTLNLSPQLKPLWAQVPALSAKVLEVPVTGRLAYDAAKTEPLTAALKIPASKLSPLNPVLKRYDVRADSGTATAIVDFAGKSAQEFSAKLELQLADFRGSRGKNVFAVKKGTVSSRVARRAGQLQAQGDLLLTAAALNGKSADIRSGYRFADRTLYLDGANLSIAGTQIALAHLSGRIPSQQPGAKLPGYPVNLDLDGASIKRGELDVRQLSGRVRGTFHQESTGNWFEGDADLASGAALWQEKVVAAPVVHAVFSRAGAKGELGGLLLGGRVAGSFSGNPFAPEAGGSLQLGLKGAGLAAASGVIAKKTAIYPSQGALDLQLKGSYSKRDGLAGRFDAKGSGIVVAGAGGKSLLSGAALSASGALAGGNLTISELLLSPGPGVTLKVRGEVAQALSPKRSGSLNFSLPSSQLSAILDPFVNMLPRLLQEATVDGTLAADGKLDLREGGKILRGNLLFKGGKLDASSQKLLVADLNGRVPFSLDLSGKAAPKPQIPMAFSRQNYPRLLEQLRQANGRGEVLTIGKMSFGALEVGKLTLHITAANGITEITSLSSALYQGTLVGRGYATMGDKLSYRGDLLLNGVSMKALCSAFPNLKGYISGRLDGVISLSGVGSGIAAMTGFTDLWARSGSGEKMLVSKEFLQRLSKQKLSGFFFSSDRPYDHAEIKALLQDGDLSFDTLEITHTNLFGVRDLGVSVASTQNRIALDHLLESIKEASTRGKSTSGAGAGTGEAPAEAPAAQEFKWGE